MSHNRVIYNVMAVYAGPAPATGFHFLDAAGNLNDVAESPQDHYNLVQEIFRVQSLDFATNFERTSVAQLGRRGSVADCIVKYPQTDIKFTYLQAGVVNEQRLGFYVNYFDSNGAGQAFPNNTGVFLLSGFFDRTEIRPTNTLNWPRFYRDSRNLFAVVNSEGNDVHLNGYQPSHPRTMSMEVIGFGNCYLTSYSTQASVGNFPSATVTYTCDNVVSYPTGSGCIIPAIEPKSGLSFNRHFNIPADYAGTGMISVVRPGDINLSISSLPPLSGYVLNAGTGLAARVFSKVDDLVWDLQDVKIDNYTINLGLNREPLMGIGYRFPYDRQINYPVLADINVGMVVGDAGSGSLVHLIQRNNDYNLSMTLANPAPFRGHAVRYDIYRAKCTSVNTTSAIGNETRLQLGFRVELDPDEFSRGLFVSGTLAATGFGVTV